METLKLLASRVRVARTGAALCAALLLSISVQAGAQVPFAPLQDGALIPAPALQQLQVVTQRDLGRAPPPKVNMLKAVPGSKPTAGKPMVLYIGAEFCPYCAAMRWPLVLALMRFGSFADLKATRSSSTDIDANTPTFSFVGAKYTSRWLDFEAVETADRHQRPLEKPSKAQMDRFKRFDRPPYTNYPGSIPFLDINDQWIQVGSPVNPGLMKGLDWFGIAAQLDAGKGPLWAGVLGEADRLTRTLCKLTKGQPAKTCKALAGD
ncbi:MAG TPA: DUF929 family protein [Nevskiaceae bacterium]|nr:DUF929 family protein [Nevskiaceae bacterium]